jgi:hypothetical protein
MYVQQAIHLTLSMPLYYTTRFFQFINTCKKHKKTFVLLPQTLLQKKNSTSIDIYYKSLIDIYMSFYMTYVYQNVQLMMMSRHVKNVTIVK